MLFPDEFATKAGAGPSDFERLTVPFVDRSDKFRHKSTNYSTQYFQIYAARLKVMATLLQPVVDEKWGDAYPVKKLADLREDNSEKCIIIGTLFKHQQLKPSILREISEQYQLVPQPIQKRFFDAADTLILEDELQRIKLVGILDVQRLVTGIVCAVMGVDRYGEGDGKFQVEDVVFYDSGPQRTLEPLTVAPLLVIISGLAQSESEDMSLSLELFQQWLFGNLTGFGENGRDTEAACVVRVIVAGNSIKSSPKQRPGALLRSKESIDILEAVKTVDNLLSNWAKSVCVDIMPGEHDPANLMWPQQPMHHCMFPKCGQQMSFRGVTNPYAFDIAGRSIIGTSGQNVADIDRFSMINDPIEALRASLQWSHIAATCPDTLSCYPYYGTDPFIMEECPHIYFAGNTIEFKTELYKGKNGHRTRLVCVPSFHDTQSVAVINLKSLDCEKLSFRISNDVFDK